MPLHLLKLLELLVAVEVLCLEDELVLDRPILLLELMEVVVVPFLLHLVVEEVLCQVVYQAHVLLKLTLVR